MRELLGVDSQGAKLHCIWIWDSLPSCCWSPGRKWGSWRTVEKRRGNTFWGGTSMWGMRDYILFSRVGTWVWDLLLCKRPYPSLGFPFRLWSFSLNSGVTHCWELWTMWSMVGRNAEGMHAVGVIIHMIRVFPVLILITVCVIMIYCYGVFVIILFMNYYDMLLLFCITLFICKAYQ